MLYDCLMNHATLTYPNMTEAFADVTFHKDWSQVSVTPLGFTTTQGPLTRALRKQASGRWGWQVVAEQLAFDFTGGAS